MIVTVTLNPSLDRTLRVDRLERGEVQRALSSTADPGGKGVNVARALAAHADDVVTVLPVGGSTGETLAKLLAEDGVDFVAVPTEHRTRANVSLVEPDGTTTKINEPGSPLDDADIDALVAETVQRLGSEGWVVTAGSLAPGQAPSVYTDFGRAARDAGARWAVDTSGPALAAALEAAPDVVKPNREELAEVVGRPLEDLEDVVSVCRGLVAERGSVVLCSLGAEGAVLATPEGVWQGVGPSVRVRNTVGAGDALLAGYLHGAVHGTAPDEALRIGIAWATAAVATPSTGVPAPELIRLHDVVVTALPANELEIA